ncbi:hypothetical protein B0G77_8837 [Paraburkholderia sp. BL10I2N1]|nr:hypothetical protein B0G77_8837 [Paraburkholderia sp. BL10I2N1]
MTTVPSAATAPAARLTVDINNGTYALGACLLISCMLILLVLRSMLARAASVDDKRPATNQRVRHSTPALQPFP